MSIAILNEISENMQRGKARVVQQLVQQAIDEGIPPKQILQEGLLSGMDVVGTKFKNMLIDLTQLDTRCSNSPSKP